MSMCGAGNFYIIREIIYTRIIIQIMVLFEKYYEHSRSHISIRGIIIIIIIQIIIIIIRLYLLCYTIMISY